MDDRPSTDPLNPGPRERVSAALRASVAASIEKAAAVRGRISSRVTALRNRLRAPYRRLRRRLREPSIRAALAIAFVATLITATTFRASEWDLHGTSCTRALAEAQMYEVITDQARKDRVAEHARAQAEYDGRVGEGLSLRATAGAIRQAASPRRGLEPELVTVGAQLQFSIARTIRPILDFTNPASPEFAASDESPSDQTRADLRETVLRALCPHVTAAVGARTPEGFVNELSTDVAEIHKTSASDSLLAVFFAGGLVLLTLSDFARGRAARALLILGLLVAALMVYVGARWLDASLREYYLVAAGAYLAIVLLTAALIARYDREPAQGPPRPEGGHQSVTSRVVLIITAAALLNTVVGTFYIRATGRSNIESAEAQNLQFRMLRASTVFRTRAYATIDGMMLLREAALGQATRDARTPRIARSTAHDSAVLWGRDSARWQTIADLLKSTKPSEPELDTLAPKLSSIAVGPYGPYADTEFPQHFFVDRTVETPARLFAQRDAFDERSTAWDRRSSRLLGVLAALALAAYLGGEALRMRPSRATYLLAVFAAFALVTGFGVGLWSIANRIPPLDEVVQTPDKCRIHGENDRLPRATAAAICFAAASYEAKRHNDVQAIELYEAANRMRPGFTVAHFLAVLTRIAHPQTGSLRDAITDEHQAIHDVAVLGLRASEPILDNVGYHELILGLSTGETATLRDSVADTARAAHSRPDTPALWFHYGAALLAMSDVQGAQAAYDRGMDAIRTGGDANVTPTPRPRGSETPTATKDDVARLVAADAMSDLEFFRGQCSVVLHDPNGGEKCDRLRPTIDSLKSQIVDATWKKSAPDAGSRFGEGLEAGFTPGGIGWRLPSTRNNQVGGAKLVVIVSSFDDSLSYWHVIPELSYQVQPRTMSLQGRWLTGYRSFAVRSRYKKCLPADHYYRVEFFVNGKRVASRDLDPISLDQYKAAAFREAGGVMCVPRTWAERPELPGSLAGGYRTHDASRGAMLFGFLDGRNPHEAAVDRDTVMLAVNRTLKSLGDAPISPASVRASPARCATSFDAHRAQPHLEFTLPRRTILAKSWRSPDGIDLVGVVWQDRNVQDAISCWILTSMTTIDGDVPEFKHAAGH